MPDKKKVVLAYSGGLDTSVAIPWISEKYGYEVIALTIDLGGQEKLLDVKTRAINAGAIAAYVVDARETFVEEFVFPALQAGAIYEDEYPLATALGRPLIARSLVNVAKKEGADAVAHGCTGKGNDQVRFDVAVAALAPDFKIIAPAREWGMSRDQELAYANGKGLGLNFKKESLYSIDENLWGRSIEAGVLEDPWIEPPEEAFAWTKQISETPDKPTYLEIEFEQGIPISIDGFPMNGVNLIDSLHNLAGDNGVGRIDHVENRLIGIKSREVYESPAAVVLNIAHRALETLTLGKDQTRMKEMIASEYADVVYNGLWYTAHKENLDAYVRSTQVYVTGTVRLKLYKGNCIVVGRKSSYSIYSYDLATYDSTDQFDHKAAEGFIKIYGLPVRTQSRIHKRMLK
jgi:argininosuccinate synthase